MNRKMKLAAAVLLAGMTAGSVWADAAAVRVSGYFSDHMVLQRGEGTSVWGKAVPFTTEK